MKIKNVTSKLRSTKFYILLLGIASTIWFLFRVIPKPSRAGYPCMRVAAPFMSTLVLYLLSLGTTTFAFRRFHKNIKNARFATAGLFLVLAIAAFSVYIIQDNTQLIARTIVGLDTTFPIESNKPIGEAKGLNPGRVVWAHNPAVVDQTYDVSNSESESWYSNSRVDQSIAKQMLNQAIREYAGEDNIATAWDKIFKSFNKSSGRGDVGYTDGEKIAVKINLTNQCCSDRTRADASPQLVNALIHELTTNAGVKGSDITLGDPYRKFRQEYVDIVYDSYTSVKYVDGDDKAPINQTVPSSAKVLVFSDGQYTSSLPQHYLDATYFINMPCLKTHNEGGITLVAKNHQGSFLGEGQNASNQFAIDMHYSLPANKSGTGNYRHTVDYMGHEETGGKSLLYIIDGIWGGESWEGFIKKFESSPFNGEYPASVFVSQDPVAIESVGFDILFAEYDMNSEFKDKYPILYKDEIADYLKQCASSDFWPTGFTYDPEGDGSALESLGVFEHWNNATDKKYSRNLGTGNGIELLYVNEFGPVSINSQNTVQQLNAYPNPFTEQTTIKLPENLSSNATLQIYDINGRLVSTISINGQNEVIWNGINSAGSKVQSGIYIFAINDESLSAPITGKVSMQ